MLICSFNVFWLLLCVLTSTEEGCQCSLHTKLRSLSRGVIEEKLFLVKDLVPTPDLVCPMQCRAVFRKLTLAL